MFSIGKKSILIAAAVAVSFFILHGVCKQGGCLKATQPSTAIPVEVLFGNAQQRLSPKISPDGTMIGYLGPVDGVTNIWVRSLAGGDDRPVTHDKGRGILTYFWAYDNQHLLYLQDANGDENWQVYKVALHDGTVTSLTNFKAVQIRIVAYQKEYPDRMLIAINDRDPKNHDVYELILSTGELKKVVENPGKFADWIADNHLKVRAAVQVLESGAVDLMIRDSQDQPWRSLGTWSVEDSAPDLYAFTADDQHLYISDYRNNNTSRLVAISVNDGTVSKIAQDPEYDIEKAGLLLHPDTHTLQAFGYKRDRVAWRVVDPALVQDFKAMQAVDHGDMMVASRSADNRFWVLAFTKDIGPVSYWIFDRASGAKQFLFDHQPQLNNYTLAAMEPIQFTARDGLTIHGYLTLPVQDKNQEQPADTKVPLVLLVHGGPWLRNGWGYNSEVQFLASRGYAVLQVNYRGSTGYGKAFLNAGFKEWGRNMQHDLTDAVQWAIQEGIADPEKVAIFGGSYGGYAALAGAAFTPDLYCCAVDIVGISNLLTFINSIPPYWEAFKQILNKRLGDLKTEEEMLKERSPLFSAHAIKIPLLIAQGANDPRVKQAESEQIVAALKEKGLPYEYLLFSDEGHGFVKPENNIVFYKKAEEFLAKYLQ
jgi:dipeptidyl aminopeptidase/acylaminoacyl peptidase